MSAVAVVGKSGTGKSTSYGQVPSLNIKGLNPETTVVMNVAGKDLPFRGWKKKYNGKLSEGGNYFESSDSDQIAKAIDYISSNRPDIKDIVLDDGQYAMAFEFMRRAKESGYGKFADIGVNTGKIISSAKNTREDLKVYFLWHPESDGDNSFKMKTVGKMVDDYLTLEGLFTVVLYSRVTKGADNKPLYQFVTNADGEFPAKSPYEMFSETYIPNDLGFVSDSIDRYNEGD